MHSTHIIASNHMQGKKCFFCFSLHMFVTIYCWVACNMSFLGHYFQSNDFLTGPFLVNLINLDHIYLINSTCQLYH